MTSDSQSLTFTETLWVYNIAWICPLLIAAGVVLAILAGDWDTPTGWQIGGVIGALMLWVWAVAWGFCALVHRSETYGFSWAKRRRAAVESRAWRKHRTRGYVVTPEPRNRVAVKQFVVHGRNVPHLWPISLGVTVDHTYGDRFDDDDEDGIINHINQIRSNNSTDALDPQTVALANALNR